MVNGPHPELRLDLDSVGWQDVIEEVRTTNDPDTKFAYEMYERYWKRGASPPKRHCDDSGHDSGSPTKLQKKAGEEDLSKMPKLDLSELGEQEELLEAVAHAATGCVDM